MKKRGFILGIILPAIAGIALGEPQISISGAVEWDTLEIRGQNPGGVPGGRRIPAPYLARNP